MNFKIGKNSQIGKFVIIGEPTRESVPPTVIGDNAIIRSSTVIYDGNTIGNGFQTGHGVLIRESNSFGNDVSIGSHTVIEHHVAIGDNVRIHSGAFIPEYSILEDDVWIGPGVVLTNAKYPGSPRAKQNLQGPKIEMGAKIGAGAVILPGVNIGKKVLVGAGSVVTADVPANQVVAGNPAKVIKEISELKDLDGELIYP